MSYRSRYRVVPMLPMNEAVKALRLAKFKTEIEDRGTIIAHMGEAHYGFSLRKNSYGHQGYTKEAIERAISDTTPL